MIKTEEDEDEDEEGDDDDEESVGDMIGSFKLAM